jgi:hypothetical protein
MKATITVLAALPALAACDARAPAAISPPAPEPSHVETWRYSDIKDPMTDVVMHQGCVTSNYSVDLQPPYRPTKAILCARTSKKEPMAVTVFLGGDGQFVCTSYKHCAVSYRADEAKAGTLAAVTPSDGSTNQVFIDDSGVVVMVALMAQSKVMRVEAEFYRAGRQVMEFNTDDFDPRRIGWDYAPSHKP